MNNMARTKLNEEEMTFLATIEPKLKTAVEARWISYLPQSDIDRMLEIWEALSGTKRAFRMGCGTCILNLAIDLGKLYFAQKPQKTANSAPKIPKGNKGPIKDEKGKETKNHK